MEPVKHMPSQRMTFRKRRVVEILRRIATHAEPFHDCARATVGRGWEGYDFGEPKRAEPLTKRQSGRLRCITMSPMLEGQTPAGFHAGRERRAEPRPGQSWQIR